jgi:hypothetical protein
MTFNRTHAAIMSLFLTTVPRSHSTQQSSARTVFPSCSGAFHKLVQQEEGVPQGLGHLRPLQHADASQISRLLLFQMFINHTALQRCLSTPSAFPRKQIGNVYRFETTIGPFPRFYSKLVKLTMTELLYCIKL